MIHLNTNFLGSYFNPPLNEFFDKLCAEPESFVRGGPTLTTFFFYSLKNHKNIGFLSNTGPDPLK